MLDDPLPGVRIAEVQQAAVLAAQNPLRMVLGQPRAGVDPFRLEPDDELDPLARARWSADLAQARGETAAGPTSHVPAVDPRAVARIPAGVDEPVVQLDSFPQRSRRSCAISSSARGCMLPEAARRSAWAPACRPGRGRLWATIHRRQTFCARIQSPSCQNCSTTSGVRTSSPGCSLKCVSSWPATTRRRSRCVAREVRRPLARPAHRDDQPSAAPLQVEVGQVAVRRPAARGADPLVSPRAQRRFQGAKSRAVAGLPTW